MNKIRNCIALIILVLTALQLTACNDAEVDKASGGKSDISVKKKWIAGWQFTSQLAKPRAGAATVIANGYMYVIGGIDGIQFVPTVEYAKINSDGQLSQWRVTSALKEERGFIDAIASHGYLYVVGGGNGANGKHLLQSVEKAKLHADGSLGPWETESNGLITPRRCSKVVLDGDYIYALGGFAGALLNTVERAKINSNGSVGKWQIENETMTMPRYVNTVKLAKGNTYVIGGHDQMKGVGITDVEWTKPTRDGELKNWQATSHLQDGRYGLSSAKYKNKIYAIGGLSGLEYLSSIEVSEIADSGTLSPWRYTTPLLEPRATFSAIIYGKWLYVIGGTNQDSYLNSIDYAEINAKGDLGFWGTQKQEKAYNDIVQALGNKKVILPNEGIVEHIQHASMYTYAYVKSTKGDVWIAGPKTELKPGDKIGFSKGVSMSNFYSKELKQQFQVILFVSKIVKK